MKKQTQELIGWYGAIALLGAYTLSSFQIITISDSTYQLLNFSGALGIVYISVLKKAYQPAALNLVWACVALISIITTILN